MFNAIHGLSAAYLSNQMFMNSGINCYDTRDTDGMNVYLPILKKDV